MYLVFFEIMWVNDEFNWCIVEIVCKKVEFGLNFKSINYVLFLLLCYLFFFVFLFYGCSCSFLKFCFIVVNMISLKLCVLNLNYIIIIEVILY